MADATVRVETILGDAPISHPAWIASDEELRSDLADERYLRLDTDNAPAVGSKGVAHDLLLGLGSPAAVAGAVRIFRLWLQRDRRRAAKIEIDNGRGDTVTVTVSTEAGSVELLQKALEDAIKLTNNSNSLSAPNAESVAEPPNTDR
jgi:membrane-associated two-gene conflict system component 1 (EACC1)